jgi:hypothetical protein
VPIASFVPLMMFAVLFGLSMDYEVFLVSRIQQAHAEGEPPRQAVISGLGSGAHVVTAAALIMFCVFSSFIINGDPTVKQFGVGLAVAVALAGVLVVTLAPALLTLFGRGVFWVPRFLDRILPHLDIEGGAGTEGGPGTGGGGPGSGGACYPPSGRGPMSAAPPAASSARMMCIKALICARWVKACGKFPQCRPVRGSISSA